MSLEEIIGTPKYKTYIEPKINIPSETYKTAVKQVQVQPKGVLISRVEKTEIKPGIPTFLTDPFLNPLKTMTLGYNLLFGTREDKLKAGAGFFPIDIKTTTAYDIGAGGGEIINQTFPQFFERVIEIQKERQPEVYKEFYETRVLGTTEIKLPEIKIPEIKFPDIFGGLAELGKYALIGGAVLIGLIIALKMGGKK